MVSSGNTVAIAMDKQTGEHQAESGGAPCAAAAAASPPSSSPSAAPPSRVTAPGLSSPPRVPSTEAAPIVPPPASTASAQAPPSSSPPAGAATATTTTTTAVAAAARPEPLQRRKSSVGSSLPPSLLRPGTEMLKVSAKSSSFSFSSSSGSGAAATSGASGSAAPPPASSGSRRVKPRRLWLERPETAKGLADVWLCWDKSPRAVGGSKREARVPVSALRDLRFGADAAAYRTQLHLSPAVEPRWLTLVYLVPPGGTNVISSPPPAQLAPTTSRDSFSGGTTPSTPASATSAFSSSGSSGNIVSARIDAITAAMLRTSTSSSTGGGKSPAASSPAPTSPLPPTSATSSSPPSAAARLLSSAAGRASNLARSSTLSRSSRDDSSASGSGSGVPVYRVVHFIAPSDEAFALWKRTLERLAGAKDDMRAAGLDQVMCDLWDDIIAGSNAPHSTRRSSSGGASTLVPPQEELTRQDGEAVAMDEEEATLAAAQQTIDREAVWRLCDRMSLGVSKDAVMRAFDSAAAGAAAPGREQLDFDGFQKFVQALKRREELDKLFEKASDGETKTQHGNDTVGRRTMSLEAWRRFLADEQQSRLSPAEMEALYVKYSDATTERVELSGFTSFLLSSSDNAPLREDVTGSEPQDMTRPLCEYYVSSSHNTYLVGNQIQGEATAEGYIRALQQGCRCVELDVWDGDNGEPVITHGHTLTSSILARDVLDAIGKYAFLASQYPVILSFEMHCDTQQQDRLVAHMRTAFGDRLVDRRLAQDEDIEALPSPEKLRGKVLVKAKNLFVIHAIKQQAEAAEALLSDSASNTSTTSSSDSEIKKVFQRVRSKFDDRSRPRITPSSSSSSISPIESVTAERAGPHVPPSAKATKALMSFDLAALLVYTVGVKARGFNRKETYAPEHMLSFSESRLEKMNRDPELRRELVSHNRGHITRAYPKGFRLTSTNYLPHHMWAMGVQLVALNWQTYDLGLELNTAMFERGGRSGYVLKPEILRKKGAERDKDSLTRTRRHRVELNILSAQQLPVRRSGSSSSKSSSSSEEEERKIDPFVEVSVYVPGSQDVLRKRTKIVTGNGFNPVFDSSLDFQVTTVAAAGMLDLVFVRFEVLNASGNVRSAREDGKGDFVGAYCASLGALSPGYRHVPLHDQVGDQHMFSTLFIKSDITPMS